MGRHLCPKYKGWRRLSKIIRDHFHPRPKSTDRITAMFMRHGEDDNVQHAFKGYHLRQYGFSPTEAFSDIRASADDGGTYPRTRLFYEPDEGI